MRRGYAAATPGNGDFLQRIYKIKRAGFLNPRWRQSLAQEGRIKFRKLFVALFPRRQPGWKYANYSVRTARIFLPSTFISMPRGGRRSDPCAIAPRTQTLPGRLVNLSGSNTVRLQGFPTMGCLAARKP